MSNAKVLGVLGALALSSSCVVGAPPGFSAGDRWTFPLVDPLDNGLLVTPVMIHGKGPYLFAIDPEATTSIIDERIAIDAGLRMDKGYSTRLRGDDGVRRGRFNAELRDIRIGSLAIEVRRAIVVPHETLSGLGRDIRGVLGRNVIADSLVFGFDRDRGLAWLQTVASFTPHPGATRIDYTTSRAEGNRATELMTHADVGGKSLAVDLTLGSVASRLRPALWPALGLGAATRAIVENDATGARREVPLSSTPARIALGPVVNEHVAVGAYVNLDEVPSTSLFLDGTLGLDFFAPFRVTADWNEHAVFLEPRGDAAAQTPTRVGRWADLAACAHVGCVTVALVEPGAPPAAPAAAAPGYTAPSDAPATPAPAFVLHVARDPGATMALEVRFRAAARPDLPDLVVELPAGAPELLAQVRGDLHGVRYDVIDASPFAVPCANPAEGCVRPNE